MNVFADVLIEAPVFWPHCPTALLQGSSVPVICFGFIGDTLCICC